MKLFSGIFFSMALLMPLLSHGQFRLGPTAGASLARTNFGESDESQYYTGGYTTGYHGGLAANYRVSLRYSLHTEWLYLYRQKSVLYSRDKVFAQDKAELHYLAVPVLYRVSFHSEIKKSHQEWYLNAGPALHYWMGGKGELETNEQAPFMQEGKLEYKIKFGEPGEYGAAEYIVPANRWQMALYAGGGVIFDMGFGKHIWLDARTSLGAAKSFFSSSAKGDYGLNLYHDNLQSSIMSWSISAGYFQDIDMFSVLKKGKTVRKKKKTSKMRKNYGGKSNRAKTSG